MQNTWPLSDNETVRISRCIDRPGQKFTYISVWCRTISLAYSFYLLFAGILPLTPWTKSARQESFHRPLYEHCARLYTIWIKTIITLQNKVKFSQINLVKKTHYLPDFMKKYNYSCLFLFLRGELKRNDALNHTKTKNVVYI